MKINYTNHLVTLSPWPVTTVISLTSILIGNVLEFQNKEGKLELILGTIGLIISIYNWFKDISNESIQKGDHTEKVKRGITLGFYLFVLSEVVIFISLFYAYFYNSLVPSIEIGNKWPSVGIITLNIKGIPLLNTILLLTSGFTITAVHNFILENKRKEAIIWLIVTILLGVIFTLLQVKEYILAPYTLTDSVFGSSFFILTGCHGLHIIIGTVLLLLSLYRLSNYYFTNTSHPLFSYSAIYWHFVDIVWLFLFIILYCWI